MSQTPDAKAYYGYLFEPNKQPTKVLDALLRGIANYIVRLSEKEGARLSATYQRGVWEGKAHCFYR
jgi:hypothetical protein